MAKKRISKRKKFSSQENGGGSFLGRKLPLFILIIILAGTFFGLRHFFLQSEFFKVREVVINKDGVYSFTAGEKEIKKQYLGRDIFTVDLKTLERSIASKYLQLKKIEVKRRLPDTIEVNLIYREPIAVIDSLGGVLVDPEGYVLEIGYKPKSLPVIQGVNFVVNRPVKGQKLTIKSLNTSLAILTAYNQKIPRDKARIEYINSADKNDILLGVAGVQIKMGADDFTKKMDTLKEILYDPNVNLNEMKYIDLRFNEVTMAPK
ncbi:MAG: cell division protein FtsQ/DivIB [Candidatus Omnitrophica bacterium]|nr:cell division protein FtsQ/DivIB [Candidatus Omnitrophota bacterium]